MALNIFCENSGCGRRLSPTEKPIPVGNLIYGERCCAKSIKTNNLGNLSTENIRMLLSKPNSRWNEETKDINSRWMREIIVIKNDRIAQAAWRMFAVSNDGITLILLYLQTAECILISIKDNRSDTTTLELETDSIANLETFLGRRNWLK